MLGSGSFVDFGQPLVVVVSGPSGVGKDAVFGYMKNLDRNWHFTITATTRPRRRTETNGVDYIFLDHDEFANMREQNQFLEIANVYGNWYGVPKQQVKDALDRGQDVLLKIDIQGADSVRRIIPTAVTIFLAPPSLEELERRLRFRKSETIMDIRTRIEAAQGELAAIKRFDYKVVNANQRLDIAAFCIDSIITAERCRMGRTRTEFI